MTLRRLPAERERIRPTFQPFVHRSRFSFLFHFATTQILEINKKRRRRKKYSLIFLYLSPKLRAMKNNFLSKIREMRVLEKIRKMWILFSRRLKLYRFSFRQSSTMNYRKINYPNFRGNILMFLNYFRNIQIMSNTTINFHKHVQKIATSPFTFFFSFTK